MKINVSLQFVVSGGKYVSKHGNYVAGQVIPHDALVDYTCPVFEEEKPRHLQCKLGHLIPFIPSCQPADGAGERTPDFGDSMSGGGGSVKLLASGSGFDGSRATLPYSTSSFIVEDGDLMKPPERDDRHTM